MKFSHAGVFLSFRKYLHLIALLSFTALLIAGFGMYETRAPFSSSEVKFTDVSREGMHIVPASCPSSPHSAGACDTPANPPSGGCSISSSPNPIVAGDSTTLSWGTNNFMFWGVFAVAPGGASISPGIGSVNPSGSASVSPTQTTTYTLSGTYTFSGIFGGGMTVGSYSCARTVTVNACPVGYVVSGGECVLSECPLGFVLQGGACVFNACPSGFVRQGNECVSNSPCVAVNYCVGSTLWHRNAQCATNPVQTCTAGCSAGACIGVPAPAVITWTVRPPLLPSGDTATVTWEVTGVRSCEVHGNNGDSWTGASGTKVTSPITAQTVFTLSCIGRDNSTVSRTGTVNILPVFCESGAPGCTN